MQVCMLRSKIHRATVTRTDLNYEGSLTLDPVLINEAGMLVNELVHVLNVNNGERFETYVIEGAPGTGEVCLNGAAARLGEPGDLIIIITYAYMELEDAQHYKPKVVHVDAANLITR